MHEIMRKVATLCLSGLLLTAAALAKEHAPANRPLAEAASPYLRHHAHDLVRWRTWGPAAFAEAKRRNLPVFLSVGYLACYWCGAMQRENFLDSDVAAFLNAHFVPVLVDREARPDVDELFVTVALALRGVAGWPNNVFLTPEGEPFHATSFLPKTQFLHLLSRIDETWRDDEEGLRKAAARIARTLREHLKNEGRAKAALQKLGEEDFRRLARQTAAKFDTFFGGLDRTPKYYRQPLLLFLARAALAYDEAAARAALLQTLRTVVRAGVRDHLEGGFYRYATDGAWHVPHFEKMLYNQALMADALREGWRISGDAALKAAALDAIAFARRHLRLKNGLFASSLAATGPGGEEGEHYLFTPQELKRILGPEDAAWAREQFGLIEEGDHAGKVIVHLLDADLSTDADRRRMANVLQKLRAAVAERPPHPRDDKAIVSWNALMIAALARAAEAWSRPDLGAEAKRAGHFILDRLHDETKGLARYWASGAAHGQATLADYANLLNALLALDDLAPDEGWRRAARQLATEAEKRFFDLATGHWWLSAASVGFARVRPRGDTALPAADSAMALALWRLAERGGEAHWRDLAKRTLAYLLPQGLKNPTAFASALRAADIVLRGDDALPRYAAGGHLRVDARVSGGKLSVVLALDEGWHVQAHRPDDPNLIPTTLRLLRPKGAELRDVRYPQPLTKTFKFADKPLKVLENRAEIESVLKVPPTLAAPLVLSLTIQACNDEICLPPQAPRLYLPPFSAMSPPHE